MAEWTTISAITGVLPQPQNFDDYLITGGKYSVYEHYDWQEKLFDFIRELHIKTIPLVGVCYGQQAIAHALSGTVTRSEKGWGVGLMPVDVVRGTGWAEPKTEVLLHAMHQDQVTELPFGAETFLSSEFCPISGFTLGTHFLAIQQHPDFTPDLNADLINRRIERIGPFAAEALRSLKRRDDTQQSVEWITKFILSACDC